MKPSITIVYMLLSVIASAQQQPPPAQQPAPRGTQQRAPVPLPGAQPVPGRRDRAGPTARSRLPQPPADPVALTLAGAIDRARTYSQQVYAATFAAQIAHEDTVQAKAALLPTATWFNQFVYTQPNGIAHRRLRLQ